MSTAITVMNAVALDTLTMPRRGPARMLCIKLGNKNALYLINLSTRKNITNRRHLVSSSRVIRNVMKMNQIIQMKIRLNGSKPAIWRRFLVSENITFHELHTIIQKIMGWSNYHLYEFTVNKLPILFPCKDYDGACEDSKKARLKDFLKAENQKLGYSYDFGDSWDHSIVVEKIMEKTENKGADMH
ncbi:MAG TPA: plasmid pRiA4b ORF-3 family protein [archaeon]|nr:plasmid pRiA4b ORF-3 family protein [archaeon]